MKNYRYRDFTILSVGNETMVMACDAAGGVGEKPLDMLKVPMDYVAYITTKVVLKELITIGGIPMAIMNGVINEMNPTGQQAMIGINKLIAEYDSDETITVNGSTEDNFETKQSGIHVVMVGRLEQPIPKHQPDQKLLVVVGKPLVGQEVIDFEHLAVDVTTLKRVRSIIKGPMYLVGSQGIRGELEQMKSNENVSVDLKEHLPLDIDKSGGPGTSCICMVTPEEFEILIREIRCPLGQIGECHELY